MCVLCALCADVLFSGQKHTLCGVERLGRIGNLRRRWPKASIFLTKATTKSPFRKGGFRGNVDIKVAKGLYFFAKRQKK